MLAFGGDRFPGAGLAPDPAHDRRRAALAAEVRVVHERGYGTVFGERDADVNAIAAPVFVPPARSPRSSAPGPGEPTRGPGPAAAVAREISGGAGRRALGG